MGKRFASLADLTPDEENANAGTERGKYMVSKSLETVGPARSVVADKDGVILAGNKTAETWGELADPDDVVFVHTSGDKLVVVVRDDLDVDSPDPAVARRSRLAALYDNRAGEVSLAWNSNVILQHVESGLDLSDMFRDVELSRVLAAAQLSFDEPPASMRPVMAGGSASLPDNEEESATDDSQSGPQPLSSSLPPPAPFSSVRMVQLFLDTETLPVFQERVRFLMELWSLENHTAVVMEALRHAFDQNSGGNAG